MSKYPTVCQAISKYGSSFKKVTHFDVLFDRANDTWNVLNMQHRTPYLKKYGIIQVSSVVALKRLQDPPTWLKVTTTLEKDLNLQPL